MLTVRFLEKKKNVKCCKWPSSKTVNRIIQILIRISWLGLKAVTGPDSAEATEITEWVSTEFTEKYGKLRSSDTEIQRRYR